MAYIYIVRCDDDTLYTGITKDLAKRMKNHAGGKGPSHAKYMRSHKPIEIAAVWECDEYKVAARLEYAIKRLKKSEKLELIANPDSVGQMLPKLCECEFRPILDVTLNDCLGIGSDK